MRKRLSQPHIPSLDAASFPLSPSEQKGNRREYAVVGLVVEFVAEAAMGMRISPHRRTGTPRGILGPAAPRGTPRQ